jgi:hypothetical protein
LTVDANTNECPSKYKDEMLKCMGLFLRYVGLVGGRFAQLKAAAGALLGGDGHWAVR